jgi:choline-sulfatase
MDGQSLAPWLLGVPVAGATERAVISEYTDMGVIAPCRMIRQGRYKYIHTHGHPAQLYDLQTDPLERVNLSGHIELQDAEKRLRAALLAGWNGDAVMADVLASQRRRLFLKEAAQRAGRPEAWDYQTNRDNSHRFVRAGGAAGAKARARFPFVSPP